MPSKKDDFGSRDYPIREDMPLQMRLWKIERFGWIMLAGIVAITLLGLFSTGPLSEINAQTTSGDLNVQYERFERNGASSQLQVKAKAGQDGQVWLTIDGDLLKSFVIESIQPQPMTSESFGSGFRLQFQADPEGWATAYFSVRPSGLGLAKSIASINGQSITLTQFIYP